MRGKHVHFYVKGADTHKKFIKYFLKVMKEEDIELIRTAVKFDCKVYMPIPSSMKSVEQLCAELTSSIESGEIFLDYASYEDLPNVADDYVIDEYFDISILEETSLSVE